MISIFPSPSTSKEWPSAAFGSPPSSKSVPLPAKNVFQSSQIDQQAVSTFAATTVPGIDTFTATLSQTHLFVRRPFLHPRWLTPLPRTYQRLLVINFVTLHPSLIVALVSWNVAHIFTLTITPVDPLILLLHRDTALPLFPFRVPDIRSYLI
jgi:hypothetical protein